MTAPRSLLWPLAVLAALGAAGCTSIPWPDEPLSREAAFDLLGRAPREMTPEMKQAAAHLSDLLSQRHGQEFRWKLEGKEARRHTLRRTDWGMAPLIGLIPADVLEVLSVGGDVATTYTRDETILPVFPFAFICAIVSASGYRVETGEETLHMANVGVGPLGLLGGYSRELYAERESLRTASVAQMPTEYHVRKRVHILGGFLQVGRTSRHYFAQVLLFPFPLCRVGQ